MAENQITESIFEAVDVIVQKAIEQIAFDKTIVCTIVKKSEDKENCYIVSDGSINFEAFSEDEYEKNEQVRVSIPNGNFDDQKYIVGKYILDEAKKIEYSLPTDKILKVFEKTVDSKNLRGTSDSIETKKEIMIINVNDNIPKVEFDNLFIEAKVQTNFQNQKLFSGDYGFNIIVENEKGKTFTYEFTNQDFFGNPWSFSLPSKQAKTFSVFEVGKIKTIKVSIFQKGDFLKKVLDNDDSNTLTNIALSGDNIFFTEISCGLGYNLSGIVDNSVKLFTSSSDNFKHYDSTTESNEKTIGLLWCNKSENNNFIGFNDGVRKIKQEDEFTVTDGLVEIEGAITPSFGETISEDLEGLKTIDFSAYDEFKYQEKISAERALVMQKADNRLDDEETLKICVELENAELTLEMMYKIGNDILKKLSSLRTNFTGNSTLQTAVSNIIGSSTQGITKYVKDIFKFYKGTDTDVSVKTYANEIFKYIYNLRQYFEYNKEFPEIEEDDILYVASGSTAPQFYLLECSIDWSTLDSAVNNEKQFKTTYTKKKNDIERDITKLNELIKNNFIKVSVAVGEESVDNYYIFQHSYSSLTESDKTYRQYTLKINETDGNIVYSKDNITTNFSSFEDTGYPMFSNLYSIYWYRYEKEYKNNDDLYIQEDWINLKNSYIAKKTGNINTTDSKSISFTINEIISNVTIGSSNCSFLYDYNNDNVKEEVIVSKSDFNDMFNAFSVNTGLPAMDPTNVTPYYYRETYNNKKTSDTMNSTFTCFLDPNKKEEKFKAVIVYDHVPYYSEEIVFSNENFEEDTTDKDNLLEIQHGSNSLSNYFLYDNTGYLENPNQKITKRFLNAKYKGTESLDNAAIYWTFPQTATMLSYLDSDLSAFTVDTSSVIETGNVIISRTIDATDTDTLANSLKIPYYIKDYYSKDLSNNVIECKLEIGDRKVYTEKIELKFGYLNSNGTNYRLVVEPLDMDDNRILTFKEDGSKQQTFKVTLYDKENKQIAFPTTPTITIEQAITTDSKYYTVDEKGEGFTDDTTNKEYNFTIVYDDDDSNTNFNTNQFYGIINVEADIWITHQETSTIETDTSDKDEEEEENAIEQNVVLNALYPIAYGKQSNYYMEGPSQIIYNSMGVSPKFYDTPYKLLEKDNENSQITISSWEMIYWIKTEEGFKQITAADLLDPEKDYKGLSSALPKIETEQITDEKGTTIINYRLRPCSMYISELDIYCLLIAKGKATSTETTDSTLWAQSILISQNSYESNLLNSWSGQSLSIDEDEATILASMLGAGRKEIDNTFSGVILGDVQAKAGFAVDNMDDISKGPKSGLGLYGLHHGAQSFGFNIDGTAFLGKSGKGRIYFDGNYGMIKSGAWDGEVDSETGEISKQGSGGMAISLENGQIDAFNFKLTSEKISLDSNPSSGDYYLKVGDENNHISFSADNELSIKAKKFELSSGSWGGTNLLSNTEPFEPRGDLIEKDWIKIINTTNTTKDFSNSWLSEKKDGNSGLQFLRDNLITNQTKQIILKQKLIDKMEETSYTISGKYYFSPFSLETVLDTSINGKKYYFYIDNKVYPVDDRFPFTPKYKSADGVETEEIEEFNVVSDVYILKDNYVLKDAANYTLNYPTKKYALSERYKLFKYDEDLSQLLYYLELTQDVQDIDEQYQLGIPNYKIDNGTNITSGRQYHIQALNDSGDTYYIPCEIPDRASLTTMEQVKSKLGNSSLNLYYIENFTYYTFNSYNEENKTLICKLAEGTDTSEKTVSLIKGQRYHIQKPESEWKYKDYHPYETTVGEVKEKIDIFTYEHDVFEYDGYIKIDKYDKSATDGANVQTAVKTTDPTTYYDIYLYFNDEYIKIPSAYNTQISNKQFKSKIYEIVDEAFTEDYQESLQTSRTRQLHKNYYYSVTNADGTIQYKMIPENFDFILKDFSTGDSSTAQNKLILKQYEIYRKTEDNTYVSDLPSGDSWESKDEKNNYKYQRYIYLEEENNYKRLSNSLYDLPIVLDETNSKYRFDVILIYEKKIPRIQLKIKDKSQSKSGHIYFKEPNKWIDFSYTFNNCAFNTSNDKFFTLQLYDYGYPYRVGSEGSYDYNKYYFILSQLKLEPGTMATPWDKSKADLDYEENRRRETISTFNSYYNSLEKKFNTSFTQDKLMAELTNGYKNQGVFLQDGQLFINASQIATGAIKSQNWATSGGAIDDNGNILARGQKGSAFSLATGELDARNFRLTAGKINPDNDSLGYDNCTLYLDSNPSNYDIPYLKIGNDNNYLKFSNSILDMKAQSFNLQGGKLSDGSYKVTLQSANPKFEIRDSSRNNFLTFDTDSLSIQVTDFKLTVPMGGNNLLNNTAPNCSDNEEIITSDADNDWIGNTDAVLMAGVKDSKKCLQIINNSSSTSVTVTQKLINKLSENEKYTLSFKAVATKPTWTKNTEVYSLNKIYYLDKQVYFDLASKFPDEVKTGTMPKKLIYTKEQESTYKDVSADYPLDNFSTFWVLDNGQYKSINRNFIDGTKTLGTELYYYKNAEKKHQLITASVLSTTADLYYLIGEKDYYLFPLSKTQVDKTTLKSKKLDVQVKTRYQINTSDYNKDKSYYIFNGTRPVSFNWERYQSYIKDNKTVFGDDGKGIYTLSETVPTTGRTINFTASGAKNSCSLTLKDGNWQDKRHTFEIGSNTETINDSNREFSITIPKNTILYLYQLLLEPGQNQTSWNLSEYDVRKVNKDSKRDASSIINKLENLEDEYRTSFTQEKLFAELTNGYDNTGIYIENGFLFINADKIATGTIASQNWYQSGGAIDDAGKIVGRGTEGMAIALETGEIDAHTFKLKAETERLGTLFLLEDYPYYDIMATASLGLSVGSWALKGKSLTTDKTSLRNYLKKKFDCTDAEANNYIDLILNNDRFADVAPEKKLIKFFDVNRDNIFSAADSRLMLRQKELFQSKVNLDQEYYTVTIQMGREENVFGTILNRYKIDKTTGLPNQSPYQQEEIFNIDIGGVSMKKGIITEIIVEKGTIDNAVVSDTTLENVKISMRNYGEGAPPTRNVAEGQIYFQILNNE